MSDLFWKNLALWLIQCECATAYREFTLKSASKCEKRRHLSILKIIADSYRAGALMTRYAGHEQEEDHAMKRVQNCIEEAAGQGMEP